MKPSCQKCGKRSIVHYIRSGSKWISIGFYCPNCDEVVKQSRPSPPIVYRMDMREFLNTTKEKYDLILCDPPYSYEIEAPRIEDRISSHYPELSTQEICDLPIRNIMADKAVLFLWSPSPKVEEAMGIIKAWNFQYKTQVIWNKKTTGLGRNVRQMHEVLLIGKKGKYPTPLYKPPSIIEERRTDHSRKPEKSYEIIERMYPEAKKIELFARFVYPNWTGVGMEAEAKRLQN